MHLGAAEVAEAANFQSNYVRERIRNSSSPSDRHEKYGSLLLLVFWEGVKMGTFGGIGVCVMRLPLFNVN